MIANRFEKQNGILGKLLWKESRTVESQALPVTNKMHSESSALQ